MQIHIPALSVSELTTKIKNVIEPEFAEVWVQGEISNFRPAASGHLYFSLKDDKAMISAAFFGWGSRSRAKPKFELEDGLHVLCRGRISVYPPRGSYQISVDQLEPLGAGALQLAFEQLKEKLSLEGLFEQARKRLIPLYPRQIAVVTSPTGAAIQDMLNILKRRAPQIRVLVIPAVVQGEDAPAQLIRGLKAANEFKLGEVIVLARGGGSIEDMWCFNNEKLARAIAESKLPVISAVGHEIDFTIADFVSDLRAPTPSAAAEIISGGWVQVVQHVHEAETRLKQRIVKDLTTRRQMLVHVMARLVSPRDRLREQAQRVDDLSLRLTRAIRVRLERKQAGFAQVAGRLDALSPLKVLKRGYSLVRDPRAENRVIKTAAEIHANQELSVVFQDGERRVQAI